MAALVLVVAGSALGSELPGASWWNPAARVEKTSAAASAVEPLVLPAESAAAVEGELPRGSLKVLRLLGDDPRRVRSCLVALREFGLLRDRRVAGGGDRARVASAAGIAD
jgi:hypothetical protein